MVMDRKQLGPIPFMLNVPHSVASSQKKRSKCIDSHGYGFVSHFFVLLQLHLIGICFYEDLKWVNWDAPR